MKCLLFALLVMVTGCGGSAQIRVMGAKLSSFKPLVMSSKANDVVTRLSGYAPMRVQLRAVYTLHDFGDMGACITLARAVKAGSPKKSAQTDQVDSCLRTLMTASESANHTLLGSTESVTQARFEWDFGVDPIERKVPDSSKTFVMEKQEGFAAGYVYDKPGIYHVNLKVTNAEGAEGYSEPVEIEVLERPATQPRIYVSSLSGQDINNGADENHAVKSVARAQALITAGSEVLFKRGEIFRMVDTFTIAAPNVRIANYGDATADKPLMFWSAYRTGPGQAFFALKTPANDKTAPLNAVVEGLTLDTDIAKLFGKYADDSKEGVGPKAPASIGRGIVDGFSILGNGILIRDITFKNVGYGVQNQSGFTDILVTQSSEPLLHGLRAYFAWNAGVNLHLIGNRCANSTREHCARSSDGHRFTVHYANDFDNIDQSADGYTSDGMKTVSNNQFGFHFTVRGNTFKHGAVAAGPLGGTDGNGGQIVAFGQIEDNDITDGSMIWTMNGLYDLTIRNNRIDYTGAQFSAAIEVGTYDEQYQRGVEKMMIAHNKIHVSAASGMGVHEGVARDVSIVENEFTNSDLNTGGNSCGMIGFYPGALKLVTEISGNTYQWPKMFNRVPYSYATDRVMCLGTRDATAGDWLAYQSQMGFSPDQFEETVAP